MRECDVYACNLCVFMTRNGLCVNLIGFESLQACVVVMLVRICQLLRVRAVMD